MLSVCIAPVIASVIVGRKNNVATIMRNIMTDFNRGMLSLCGMIGMSLVSFIRFICCYLQQSAIKLHDEADI